MSIKQAIEALEELVEYAETAGFDWSLDNARAAISALRSMPAEPVAWLVPEIMSFKGVKFTSCPKEAQDAIEGTVGWSPSMIGDMPPVTDKHGVTHHPKPLYATPPPAPVLSDAEILRAAVAAMPHTNPGVADDLIAGFTMHTEAEDIIAIWKAAERAVLRGGEK